MDAHYAVQTPSNQAVFLYNDANCTVSIKDDVLYLNCTKHASGNSLLPFTFQNSIELVNVVSTTYGTDEWRIGRNGRPISKGSLKQYVCSKITSCFVLTIHYWIKAKKRRRKLQTVNLRTSNEKDCKEKSEFIKRQLGQTLKRHDYNRPSKLLVIINPNSGKKNAKSIHQKLVGPLFKLAGIEETVFVTKQRFQAQEYIESTDMSKYDGVVVFGGDGTISEVVNGVLVLEQKNRGIPLDHDPTVIDKQVTYAKPSIKIGFVPVGTGNGMAYVSQGVSDPETSALHIICGENHPMDVTSIHNDVGKLIAFSAFTSTFGTSTQSIRINERYRYLGSLKYIISGIYSIFRTQLYPCEIFYLQDSKNSFKDLASDTTRCRYPCSVCLGKVSDAENESTSCGLTSPLSHFDSKTSEDSEIKLSVANEHKEKGDASSSTQVDDLAPTFDREWKVTRGQFSLFSCFSNSCKYESCPNGISPTAHMADGTNDLLLLRSSSMKDLVNFSRLLFGANNYGEHLQLPFVKTKRVYGFHFRVLSDHNVNRIVDADNCASSSLPVMSQWLSSQEESNIVEKSSVSGWAADGEIVSTARKHEQPNDDITCWVHKGLINVFAKGIDEE